MADLIFQVNKNEADAGDENDTSLIVQPMTDRDGIPFDLIELLFFAYRDFIGDPDVILQEFEFGRAHHRVLHFVNRNPGIRVADLLDILQITKQSLGRVLKQLVDTGFIVQQPGPIDRRQRLLFPTPKGRDLALALARPQADRMTEALAGMSKGERTLIKQFLTSMINSDLRDDIGQLIQSHDDEDMKDDADV